MDFADDGWAQGATPIGYGEPEIVTTISDMRNEYTTLFLRKTFELSDATAIDELVARVDWDDGFVMWINELEVLRRNVAGVEGSPVAYDDLADSGHESGTAEEFLLPNPLDFLVNGTNVVAVQIFNQTLTSSDLLFDVEIFDPEAPDLSPPVVERTSPAPGATIRNLSQIEVRFSEDVSGVDAGDLLVGSTPATGVTGSGAGPYTFTFPAAAPGVVDVEWDASHGIADLSDVPNAFGGGSWSYTVDPDAPLGNLVINEFVALNGSGLRDEDNEESDWAEIVQRRHDNRRPFRLVPHGRR